MNCARKFVLVIPLAMVVVCAGAAQSAAPASPNADFAPFQQWMGAILTGDAAGLKELYSTNPPAQIRVKTVMHDADADISFWIGKKVRSMNVDLVRGTAPRPDITHLILRIDMVTASSEGKPVLITDDQVWQKQADQWRMVSVERTDAPSLKQPSDMKKEIYPASADAHAELKEAEEKAARDHKRVLLVFGANWCFDCHVLDIAFRGPELGPIIAANYEVVHIDLGPDEKKNADLVQQFDIPLNKGIPAMAVADSDGKLIVSQKNGEVEDARQLTPEFLAEFLNKWKPQGH
ncbi:MAG TPA: thioredoxin family protein [Candidatus Sulfotelmatobacter sp.]|nr:thioredoxin family protein [Candidatus Sulfotelmatobacter sp.]